VTQHIIVRGRKVTVKIDGKTVLEYNEPPGAQSGRRQKLAKGLCAPGTRPEKHHSLQKHPCETAGLKLLFGLLTGGQLWEILSEKRNCLRSVYEPRSICFLGI